MQIRTMTIQDYEQVYALWLSTPGMGLNDKDDSPEGIARYLQRNPTTCFVAEENGAIVGALLSGHDGRRGYVSHTAVARDFQRRGIGTALVQHMLAAMRGEGICKVNLVAFARNTQGNAFWEKQGFTTREDLVYRNRALTEMQRIDT